MPSKKDGVPQPEIVETGMIEAANYSRRVDYAGCMMLVIDHVAGKGFDNSGFHAVTATLEDGNVITLNLSDEQINAFHGVNEDGVVYATLINAKPSDGYRTEGWKLLSCTRANKVSASAFSTRISTAAIQSGKMDAAITNRGRFASFEKSELDLVSMLLRI